MGELTTGPQPAVDMGRAIARAAALLLGLMLLTALVFGPPWAMRGIWWGGVRSRADYRRQKLATEHWLQPRLQLHRVRLDAAGTGVVDAAIYVRLSGAGWATAGYTDRVPVVFHDRAGRPIVPQPVQTSRGPGYRLALPPGLRAGDELTAGARLPVPAKMLRRQGAGWLYTFHHTPDPPIHYRQELLLPPGAVVLAADPPPTSRRRSEGCPLLILEYDVTDREVVSWDVRYTVPG